MFNNKNNIYVIETKFGNFEISIRNKNITRFYPTVKKETLLLNPMIKLIKKEIDDYIEGRLSKFTFKSTPFGTIFELKVWIEIKKINYGQTMSYLNIAEMLQTYPRAVGNACSRNTCLLFIPCHRVIKEDKTLGGFLMGKKNKEILLKLERQD